MSGYVLRSAIIDFIDFHMSYESYAFPFLLDPTRTNSMVWEAHRLEESVGDMGSRGEPDWSCPISRQRSLCLNKWHPQKRIKDIKRKSSSHFAATDKLHGNICRPNGAICRQCEANISKLFWGKKRLPVPQMLHVHLGPAGKSSIDFFATNPSSDIAVCMLNSKPKGIA